MGALSAAGARRRYGATVVAMAAGALIIVVGSLLPWLRTGTRQRNSYDAFAVAERLGFGPEGVAAQGLRWWPLVPLLTALAVVIAWWGWRRPGGAVGVLTGIYAAGMGTTVALADGDRFVVVRPGAVVTAVGGTLLLLASAATLVVTSSRRVRSTPPAR